MTDAWAVLAAWGATVHRVSLAGRNHGQLVALAMFEEARIRALIEGHRAGWSP